MKSFKRLLKNFKRIFLKTVRFIKGNLIIKPYQWQLLRYYYRRNTDKLIVFLTPGHDIVCGGVISISSIYSETLKLWHIHKADAIMCTVPGDPVLLRYTKFENKNYIYRFSQFLSYFNNLKGLMIHVPEYAVAQFLNNLSIYERDRLSRIEKIHINIMIQNIDLMPPVEYIERLKKIGMVTCTTAHEQYSTIELRKQLGVPLHYLFTYGSPEQYHRKKYHEKENLMIVSPDEHPEKSKILDLIACRHPDLKIQVIKGITYEEYKKTISNAKWALTFGEGLDGYFSETIFSGGISFAVYNNRFFTDDFKSLKTVYKDFTTLAENICFDIHELDDNEKYTVYQNKQFEILNRIVISGNYKEKIKLFYNAEYTYP